MSESTTDVARRLEQIRTVFTLRRARLRTDIARAPARLASQRPLDYLQHNGYATALLLALSAAVPSIIGFAFRRRNMVISMLMTALRLRKWRAKLGRLSTVDGPAP